MSERQRRFVTAGTLWSSLYVVPYVGFFVFLVVAGITQGRFPVSPTVLVIVWALTALTVLWDVVLLLFYLRHLARSPQAPENKVLWTLFLLIGTQLAMLVYWWRYLRGGSDRPPRRAAS